MTTGDNACHWWFDWISRDLVYRILCVCTHKYSVCVVNSKKTKKVCSSCDRKKARAHTHQQNRNDPFCAHTRSRSFKCTLISKTITKKISTRMKRNRKLACAWPWTHTSRWIQFVNEEFRNVSVFLFCFCIAPRWCKRIMCIEIQGGL